MPTLEKIIIDGVEREYVLYIPKNVLKNPDVIISLHGGGSNGKEWWSRHWHRQTDKGFIIVCPTAGNHQGQTDNWVCLGDEKWGAHLDIKIDEHFILGIIKELKTKYQTSKVFLTGFSSGAKMTHSMYVSQADKFDGFGITGSGLREAMSVLNPPAVKPLRISFGTKDDNYFDPDPDVFDGPETLAWYIDLFGFKNKTDSRLKSSGSQNTALTLSWNKNPALEATKIIGMPHRWAQVAMGDPYNEDDIVISFFKKHAGMK